LKLTRKIFLIIIFCSFLSEFVIAQWELTNGPLGIPIRGLTQSSKTKSIFARTESGEIYRCKYKSNSWELLPFIIASPFFQKIESGNSFICIPSQNNGIYKSTDDGENWTEVYIGSGFSNNSNLYCKDNIVLIANNACKLYMSTDSGCSFSEVSGNLNNILGSVASIVIFKNRIIVAGRDALGNESICYSDDWGLNWTFSATVLNYVSFVSKLRAFSDKLYFVENSLISESNDGGITWNQLNTSFIPSGSWTSDIYVSNKKVIIGTFNDGIFITEDYSNSFSPINFIKQLPDLSTNLFLQTSDRGLMIGSEFGAFNSLDMGLTWRNFDKKLPVKKISCLTECNHKLLAGADLHTVYLSNEGMCWTNMNHEIANLPNTQTINDIISVGKRIIVGTTQEIYFSDNYGVTWIHNATGLPVGANCVFYQFKIYKEKIYAATSWGIYYSEDCGMAWQKLSNGPDCHVLALDIKDSIIIAGNLCSINIPPYGTTNIWRSDDLGLTFHSVLSNCFSKIKMIDTLGFGVGMSGYNFFYRSNDKGLTWFHDTTFGEAKISDIEILDEQDIYIGTEDGKIFFSPDTAKTWTDISGNYYGKMVDICKFGNYLYIATQSSGIWRRNISGTNETALNPFLIYPNPVFDNLTIENPDLYGDVKVEFYNIQGQLIKNLSIFGLKTEIDMGSFAGGVYIIKLKADEKSFYEKIVKE